jgi:hypothetical protein
MAGRHLEIGRLHEVAGHSGREIQDHGITSDLEAAEKV